jgi:two-component system, chemotaxis family, chemotaxis protein CheY
MKATILVVDDQADEREALTRLLRRHDYEVEAVANGQEAIERARRGARPDLVVLDLNMPVMDGWEFLERAGDDGALRDMPVVVTSAAPEIPDAMLRQTRITFVAKPLRPQVMMKVISDLLQPAANDLSPRAGEDAVVARVDESDTAPYPAVMRHALTGRAE